MPNFVKAEYTKDYNKKNYKSISIRLNNDQDADLIKWLNEQPNLTEFLRKLLRSDMKASQRKHRWHVKGSSYEHNNIKAFPYEVLEALPHNDYYSIGYARTMDDAAILIINYCAVKGTPDGELFITERAVEKLGNGYCVRSKRYGIV